MTVSYQYDVASSASGGFIRLLFRWKGSVWKVVYREMLIFTVCYIVLTILYQFALSESQQRIFERIVFFCSTFMDLIPLSFMLGFYVSFIAARWWSQFIAIPWPDKLMNIIAMYIPGFDEDSRVVRRTLMRYLNLSLVLVLRSISMAVKRRFPTKEHLIEAGFMTKTELEMFQSVPSTEFNTFWIPCTWFISVLRAARQECRITDSNGLKLIMEELNEFRSKCGLLWGYDWISIPLVYTQVVTMATYAFYVACMFGRQNVNVITDKPSSPEVHRYDYYIPIFTILQLMFYMGLLKVAEQLINPFGDDDEDFELNWIIDRHMKVSYLGVDTLNSDPPPLVKDTYYNELDVKIPYTEASKSYKKKTYRGSVAYMQVPMEQQGMVLPDMSEEEDDGENASETMGPRRPSVYTLFQTRGKSGSFSNLSARSIGSIESLFKSSLPNLSSTAKNASGTLGCNQAAPFVVDMAKAEDDEIVLQEVIVDRSDVVKPLVQRSNSLQIPGAPPQPPPPNGSKVKESLHSRLRGWSPKIAPKFPREKLKSMFRKRKLSSAFPFYKLKGVRFTGDTKEDSTGSIHQSLLDVSGHHETMDVEITLSTPELTETEKETGVHPYYYTQHSITSVKQLATCQAVAVRQPSLTRSESEEKKFRGHRMGRYLVRSNSLPTLSHPDDYAHYIHDPIIESSLKKISSVKHGEKTKKHKAKRRSPPPMIAQQKEDSSGDARDSETVSDTESIPRGNNTLPQITLTRCGQKAPEHLEPATPVRTEQPRERDSDSERRGSQGKRDSIPTKGILQSPRTSQQNISGTSPSQRDKVDTAPEPHSTSKKPQSSPHHAKIIPTDSKDEPRKEPTRRKSSPPPMRRKSPPPPTRRSPPPLSRRKSSPPPMRRKSPPPPTRRSPPPLARRRSSPPPMRRKSPPFRRPEKLMFTKFTPTKKIAGISLKSDLDPPSPTIESTPSSPISDIPTVVVVGDASVPRVLQQQPAGASSTSPKHSPTSEVPTTPSTQYPIARADTTITISDPEEDTKQIARAQSSRPPEIPQRHIPRAGGKGGKK